MRDAFRTAVFARDNNFCRVCGSDPPLDAHHITDRNGLPNGGYVKENGIALCDKCHAKAEVWHSSGKKKCLNGFGPDDLYKLIGSSYEKAVEASEKLGEKKK